MLKLYAQNRSNLLNEILPRVELTTNMLKADVYLTWNGVLQEQTRNIELARENGIKTAILNHGFNGENDHANVYDSITGQGNKPMTADLYMCYGQQGKDILLKAGVPEDKITIVGCPICWDYHYLYEYDGSQVAVTGYMGETITDPKTGEVWKLIDSKIKPVEHLGGSRVAYFPDHSTAHKELTKRVYNEIKDMPNLCIKGTREWLLLEEDNPFKEILDDKSPDRIAKMVCPDIQHPESLEITKALIKKSKVVVCDIPSTLNLIAYACGVPVVMPKHDMGIKKANGKPHSIYTKADIVTDDIGATVERILTEGLTAKEKKEIKKQAEYCAGISLNPTESILKALEALC